MKEHTRQHYIPQTYLSHFSTDGKGVWVYNKKASRKYCTSIDKICYTDDFYSLEEQTIEDSGGRLNRLSIEKNFFAKNVEIEWASLLRQLDKYVDENIKQNPRPCLCIDSESKSLLSQYIAVQFLRLPEYRQQHEDAMDSLMRAFRKITDCNNVRQASNFHEIFEFLNKHRDSAMDHYEYGFGSKEIVQRFSSRLAENYWEFYINPQGTYFTSDFPITVEPHIENAELECLGLTMYGAEVTFPITRHLLLKIWDKRYFSNKKESDGDFLYADEKFVRCENIRQYLYARNIVISSNEDFSVAEFIKSYEGREVSMHPNFKVTTNWD